MHYSFYKDLKQSKLGVSKVADYLEQRFGEKPLFCDDNSCDLFLENQNIKVEVKEDYLCAKTGNVALEFECNGKPSGIQTSQSFFYVYIIHSRENELKAYLFKTDDLKTKIKNRAYKRIVSGGDNGTSKNYLFTKDVFVKGGLLLYAENI